MPAKKSLLNRTQSRSEATHPFDDATLRTVSNRWTPRLAAQGWTPISSLFLQHYHQLNIRPVEALFIIHLMSFKWNKKAPFPRFGVLAKQMGVTAAAVRSYARSLERKGFLKRQARFGSASRFLLQPLFDALHAVLDSTKSETNLASQQYTSSHDGAASTFKSSDPASHILRALALLGDGVHSAKTVAAKADEPLVKVRHLLRGLNQLGYVSILDPGMSTERYYLNEDRVPELIETNVI